MVAGALGAGGMAQADVLNFENIGLEQPILLNANEFISGNFFVDTYTGAGAGFAGFLFDGSDGTQCDLQCPVNNPTSYLGIFDDSYILFGLTSGLNMRVTSLQASFIGIGDPTVKYGATAGILVMQGYNAAGAATGGAIQVPLARPDASGNFNFANYNLGAFGNTEVNIVRILGYACDAAGSCTRASGMSNFAIDNINATVIPEPASIALFGLAAAGLIAARRRRAA